MPLPSGAQTYSEQKRTRKLRWWHESLVDFMLANPGATDQEMADHFGRNKQTIMIIRNTDAFKAYYSQRRAEYNGELHTRIISKQHDVVESALDAMLKSIQKRQDSVPLNLLNDIAKTGMAALGHGPGSQPAVQVNVQQNTTLPVTVSVSDLEEARMAIRMVEQQRLAAPETKTLEHESASPVGVPEAAVKGEE